MSASLHESETAFDLHDFVAEAFSVALTEMGLDEEYGPDTRHHPNRYDWSEATRPDRIRRNILANLPAGRPGRFRRRP